LGAAFFASAKPKIDLQLADRRLRSLGPLSAADKLLADLFRRFGCPLEKRTSRPYARSCAGGQLCANEGGNDGHEGYTAIAWGVYRATKWSMVGAETVDLVERNMSGLYEAPSPCRDRRTSSFAKGTASETGRSHVCLKPKAAGPHREGEKPKPMMQGRGTSHPVIVAVKPVKRRCRECENAYHRR